MTARIGIWFGAILAFALMMGALWVWQNAAALTYTFDRPESAALAARIAAVGMGAAAQMLIAVLVVKPLYRRDLLGDIYGLAAAAVCAMSLAGAVVLTLAGR